MNTLLWLLLVIPAAGAIGAAVLGSGRRDAVRWLALAATVVNLVLSLVVVANLASEPDAPRRTTFQPKFTTVFPLVEFTTPATSTHLAATTAINFSIGLDGLNVWLVLLTTLLMVPSVLVSWNAITERSGEYYAWLLALETAMLGVFLAFDIFLFYVFFELTLVPLFFLIGIWGGPMRQHAARKFFIYTLAGSLITLLGVLGVVLVCYLELGRLTFAIPELVGLVNGQLTMLARDPVHNAEALAFWRRVETWVFVAMMAGFAIKVPLFPVHTWLPLAHVEAPTAGSVLLAGVLLKIGVYGFFRLCLPLAPDAALSFGMPLIGWLAVVGIIYGAFCALAQEDIKKLVAYSSVSHLGFCMLGLFALNEAGLSGSLMQMINHGLSTGGLFLVVGMLYERYHTRRMADYGGMAARLHLLAIAMVFVVLTSVGLPGLNGFIGEALVLFGMYGTQGTPVSGILLACLAASGVLLGAWYLLTMLRAVFFGEVKEPHHEGHGVIGDLNLRELAALVPIGIACVCIGVYPQPMLDVAKPDVKVVAHIADGARARAESPSPLRGRGVGSEGAELASRETPAPHPQPLSPEGRVEKNTEETR